MLVVRPEPDRGADVSPAWPGWGSAREKAAVMTEEPLLGLGLAAAGRAALAEAGRNMNEMILPRLGRGGESYGFREQGLLLCRFMRETRECTPSGTPPSRSARRARTAGVMPTRPGSAGLSQAYAPGPLAICTTSSDSGERAVAVLERQLAAKAEES